MDGSLATHDMLGLRLDWIYLRGLAGSEWGVEDIDFSDHRAVWLRLGD
jgi:endonuclease/exonuclease/phosphatase (EEP) superfamily protein YafD